MQRQTHGGLDHTRLHCAAGTYLGSLQPKVLQLAVCAHLAGNDLPHCLLPLPKWHGFARMHKSQEALPLLLQSMGQRHLKCRVLEQDSFTESDAVQSHALAHVLRCHLKQAWSGDTAT